jgi:hypothetical protein
VALEVVFRDLQLRLQNVETAMNLLQTTVEDRPPDDYEPAVAEHVERIVLSMMGVLHEMRRTASLARRRVGRPPDLDGARQALVNCQEQFHKFEQEYSSSLGSYEQLKQLARLGPRRGEWPSWGNRTKQDIEQCREPLQDTSKALAACWQELVEHSGKTSISIRTDNLGQKIFAKGVKDTAGSSAT